MGVVDRGGGRESKGNSLRRSTKNPGAAAARAAGAKQAAKPPAQPEVPPALHKRNKKNLYFDCSAALLSRQFDADIEEVLDRAEQTCAGVVVWSADISKQPQLVAMAQENSGFVYAALGLHPDNVRGTHQREFEKWFQQIEDSSKMRGCVAILSGLNLLRETATHFSQEHVLKTMLGTAKKNGRPIILHTAPKHTETAERLLTLLEEFRDEEVSGTFPVPIILHNFLSATNYNAHLIKKFSALVGSTSSSGNGGDSSTNNTNKVYFTVSAAELSTLCGGSEGSGTGAAAEAPATAATTTLQQQQLQLANFIDCLFGGGAIPSPASTVLLASDSPWHTPQTIADDYVRSTKNEPSNFPNIIEALELAVKTFVKQQQTATTAASTGTTTSAAASATTSTISLSDEKSLLDQLSQIVSANKELAIRIFGIPEKDVEIVVTTEESAEKKKAAGKKGSAANEGGAADAAAGSDDEHFGKKKGKGGKGKNKKGARGGDSDSENDEEETKAVSSSKKGGANDNNNNNKKKGGKGGKKNAGAESDDDDEPQSSGKKGGNKSAAKNKKGGKKGGKHDDSESEQEDEEDGSSKKIAKNGSQSSQKQQQKNKEESSSDSSDDDDSDGSNSSDEENSESVTATKAPNRQQNKKPVAAAKSVHYACLKCRTQLFNPSDLIVPNDASLCSQGFFVKPRDITTSSSPSDANNNNDENDEEDDEDAEKNKLLPFSLRVTPGTNGAEIECRKCGAAKIGRCGFKLGVPGFGIRITPSKVEVVDNEVSIEDLQRKAIAEAERFQREAEEAENASSDDEDGRKGKRTQKKNVKTNNRSNFTHFRNKNFAPKGVAKHAVSDEVLGGGDDEHGDSDWDDKPGKGKKGKR